MRMILMLLALLIVGLLVYRQLGGLSDRPSAAPDGATESQAPRVPQRPQDLPAFEQEMQQFMEDSAQERRQQLDALER
ncbi:hypothetical protein [Thioalkalivibrio sp.]|uniref:hypothetical protein n=1 Tax=Thioalkalivibrio sp. TaxID=2093813 RepID=UPI00356A952F